MARKPYISLARTQGRCDATSLALPILRRKLGVMLRSDDEYGREPSRSVFLFSAYTLQAKRLNVYKPGCRPNYNQDYLFPGYDGYIRVELISEIGWGKADSQEHNRTHSYACPYATAAFLARASLPYWVDGPTLTSGTAPPDVSAAFMKIISGKDEGPD